MLVFAKVHSIMARLGPPLGMLCVAGTAILLHGSVLVAPAQSNPQAAPDPPKAADQKTSKPAKKTFTLKIQDGEVVGVSLKAEKALLSDIAAELAKSLKTRVVVDPAIQKELVTMEFADLTLDVAVRLLAPRVYIDYEIRAGARPARLGILLFGLEGPGPASNAIVTGDSQAMLIQGNTEEGTDAPATNDEEEVLAVELDGDELSVKSKKQPLAAVVLMIADVLGIPAEIRYDSTEVVDTEIKKELYENAIPRLSPNVRLFVRADLTHATKTPLRVVVVGPEKTTAQ
jgi:hypothetical protein